MQVISQAFIPKITLSHFSGNSCEVYNTFFSDNNKTLNSYSWERSINNFSGSFSFSFKELPEADKDLLMDKIQNLDIVHIYEHDKLVFIGIITDISCSAQSGSFQKSVSVQGKSIEYLFEMLQISLDVTALAWANKASNEGLNITFLTEINEKDSSGKTKKTSVKNGLSYAFNSFTKCVLNYKEVSSVEILNMIQYFYEIKNTESDFENILETDNLEFHYPISSQLYQNKTIKYFEFIRNLLPEPVYEVFGKFDENDKLKICVREVPFREEVWDNLRATLIQPVILLSYSFARSCSEVYTTFLSYLEGTLLAPDYYKKINGSTIGYAAQKAVVSKIGKYGYRPLEVTFIGFYNGKTEEEQKEGNDALNKEIETLNENLAQWFGHIDEMYNGSISVANVDGFTPAKIGERIQLGSNEFYVISEKHTWSYGSTPVIEYSIDRGGKYNKGKFYPCEKLSMFLEEFETV